MGNYIDSVNSICNNDSSIKNDISVNPFAHYNNSISIGSNNNKSLNGDIDRHRKVASLKCN